MAKNDTILLDGIVAQRIHDCLPSSDKGEVFEYFSFEQILKDFDLSTDELNFGWVDGGMDGLFLFVNGTLLTDTKTFAWPRATAAIELFIISAKHHDTFEMKPVESLCSTVQEFFDLGIDNDDLKADYSKEVLEIRTLFHGAYAKLAAARPTLKISFIYASRGDASQVADNIKSRATQTTGIVSDLFSSADVTFEFIGAAELISKYRREKSFAITLPVAEHLSSTDSGYVVLAKIDDYASFVTDENGHLRRYLFDSNVRDYLGKSQVNLDILASLNDQGAGEFWWLNNGVTILTTHATLVGKKLHLDDIQIVNGLQTTESIFEYRKSPGFTASNRCVLVKAIVSTEPKLRDQIIKATNNQNIVETAGLRATDKVQRDIEEYLERFSWYYERRKNYYKNVGKPAARFVTPLYLAAAVRAILLKQPHASVKLKAKFMRQDSTYKEIFSEATPLPCWRVVVEVYKASEAFLQDKLKTDKSSGIRFIASWRGLLSFLTVSRLLGTFAYNLDSVAALDPTSVTENVLRDVWDVIKSELAHYTPKKQEKSAGFCFDCCTAAAKRFGIKHFRALAANNAYNSLKKAEKAVGGLPVDFLDRLRQSLPPKPWSEPIIRNLASQMQCKVREIHAGLRLLRTQDQLTAGTHPSIQVTPQSTFPPLNPT